MKTLALGLALILQTTGLWSHLPGDVRSRLADTAVTMPAATPNPTALSSLSNLSLPIRTATNSVSLAANTSAVVLDRASATPLYAKDSDKQRPIASITKLVTAIVILSRHKTDEQVVIPTLPSYTNGAVVAGVLRGETYRLGDLVRLMLVSSANDIADALAIYSAGSLTKFAAQMNLKIAAWDISGTRFTNANGLQDEGNYATATALGHIAQLALTNPTIREAVGHHTASAVAASGRVISGETTNELLASGRFYGIKTGYTLAAGQCFVGITRANGHEVITVVLGSPDRFGETTKLVNWIERNYQWL